MATSMPIINNPVTRVSVVNPYVPQGFTKMTANTLPYNISKGDLNKLRIRPQVLNEACESSSSPTGVVSSGNIVGQIFKASQDNINGLYLTLESANITSVDNFEGYIDSAALQAAWVATGALALLETTIVKATPNAMRLPTVTAGDLWTKTIPAADLTEYTGSLWYRQSSSFTAQKVRVFVGDGTNTKSLSLPVNAANTWKLFSISIDAMVEDGAGTTNVAAITQIGFRVEKKDPGSYCVIDTISYTPPPGSVELKLWDMGTTLPESGVTSIDSGDQYVTIGDLALTTPAASYEIQLIGGKSLYHLHKFAAGVALENPANVLLNVDHYYILALEYIDTDVTAYGPDPSYAVNRYTNGYAFTAPSEAAAITAVGVYSDLMFGIFSTANVYITKASAKADASPGSGASYYSFVEDEHMDITDVIHTHGFSIPMEQTLDLGERPPLLRKGGKFEIYYKDDFADAVSQIWFGMQYFHEPVTVHG